MKKIISTIFLFGILVSANTLSAQKMTQQRMKAINTDDVTIFKKHFTPADYNKCLVIEVKSYSPLGFAVTAGKKNIITFLLNNKADMNKTCDGMTPLEIAESGKDESIKQLLLERSGKRN